MEVGHLRKHSESFRQESRGSHVPKMVVRYISEKYISLYGVIFSELFIYFENNPDATTMSCYKNRSTDLGFHACCEIFNIISRSLESHYEIKFKK